MKCKFCKSEFQSSENTCPICGVEQAKTDDDLTKDEDKIVNAAWLIRVVAVGFILGGCWVLVNWSNAISRAGNVEDPLKLVASLVWAALLFVCGFSLRKYKPWSFYAAQLLLIVVALRVAVLGLTVPLNNVPNAGAVRSIAIAFFWVGYATGYYLIVRPPARQIFRKKGRK